MNEAPSNQTGLSDFSSQPASQTNPFTADLKGEFTSNFGTNTNAVSQIFKEGGFAGGNNRTKYLIIGGVAVVVLAIAFFLLTGESSTDPSLATDGAADLAEEDAGTKTDEGETDKAETAEADAEGETDKAETAEADAEGETETADTAKSSDTAATGATKVPRSVASSGGGVSIGSGPISLTEPADGSSLTYDESQGPAMFSWSGGGGYIVFSRNQSMNPTIMRVAVSGNSYQFHHPWPGTWYWKVENRSGSTEVRSFNVSGPARRNVQITAPAGGGAVAGNGGTVTWQGDAKVAYYRVEISSGGWANPQHRFASSGNSVTLNGVAPGQYQMRVGAFSEVSGRWEYTAPVAVTVQ